MKKLAFDVAWSQPATFHFTSRFEVDEKELMDIIDEIDPDQEFGINGKALLDCLSQGQTVFAMKRNPATKKFADLMEYIANYMFEGDDGKVVGDPEIEDHPDIQVNEVKNIKVIDE